jgi:hypothetical protein
MSDASLSREPAPPTVGLYLPEPTDANRISESMSLVLGTR